MITAAKSVWMFWVVVAYISRRTDGRTNELTNEDTACRNIPLLYGGDGVGGGDDDDDNGDDDDDDDNNN